VREDREANPESPGGGSGGNGGEGMADGILRVLDALRSLETQIEMPPEAAVDPDTLADLLFDHAGGFPDMQLLYLLTVLQVDRLTELADEYCTREYLLLDACQVADASIVTLYTSYLCGARKTPFRDWAREAIHETCKRAVDDAHLAAFKPENANAGEEFIMCILANMANRMDSTSRRLIWLSWVAHLSLPEIASETGVPIERVEFLLASVADESRRRVKDLLDGKLPVGEEARRRKQKERRNLSGEGLDLEDLQ